jgi:hypothetical protein
LSECHVGRKTAYTVFYLGFFAYDLYQLQKIFAITNASNLSKVALYFVLFIRVASYALNVYLVSGAFIVSGATSSACKSKFPDHAIYQEHAVSLLYEFSLMMQLTIFVVRNGNEGVRFTEFLLNVLDYETISFVFYLLAEIIYIIAFTTLEPGYISLLNTFYLNVPVALFLFNSIIFLKKIWSASKEDVLDSIKDVSVTNEGFSFNRSMSLARINDGDTKSIKPLYPANRNRDSLWSEVEKEFAVYIDIDAMKLAENEDKMVDDSMQIDKDEESDSEE